MSESEHSLVQLYLTEAGRYPVLGRKEEKRLACQARFSRKGSRIRAQARQKLIDHNLRLVISIAKKYQSGGLPLLDLIQEGNIGLLEVVERFDPRRNFKFSVLATHWIKKAIRLALFNKGRLIRLPRHMVRRHLKVQEEVRQRQAGDEDGDLARVAGALDLSLAQVTDVLELSQESVRLDDLTDQSDDGGNLDLDGLSCLADERFNPARLSGPRIELEQVRRKLARLGESKRNKKLFSLRCGLDNGGEGRTLEAVGREVGLTRERVRQIEDRVRRKLIAFINDGSSRPDP